MRLSVLPQHPCTGSWSIDITSIAMKKYHLQSHKAASLSGSENSSGIKEMLWSQMLSINRFIQTAGEKSDHLQCDASQNASSKSARTRSGTLELSVAWMQTELYPLEEMPPVPSGAGATGSRLGMVTGSRLGIAASRHSPGTPARHSAGLLSASQQPERGQWHRRFELPRSAARQGLPYSGPIGEPGEQGQ